MHKQKHISKPDSIIEQAYIAADNIYEDFVKVHFENFEQYLQWESDNQKVIELWKAEREFRLVEGCKSGLYEQALKGNAAAVTNLRSLLGLTNSPGRPKGKTSEKDSEYQAALKKREEESFMADVERLMK